MKPVLVEKGIPVLCGLAAVAALWWWVASYFAPTGIKDRPLGLETAPPTTTSNQPGPKPPDANQGAVSPATGTGVAAVDLTGNWPCFRGPDRDGVCKDSGPLNRDWGKQPPRLLWSVDLGEGYAGAAVHKGCVYVLDYDMVALADTLRCLSLADGKEIWKRSYPVVVKRYHGMSRTVPAVTDQYVVTLGPKCHVMCCDLSGKQIWFKDLVAEYGTTVPEWYAGQCPLIDGDKVILAPGGKSALLMAVDLATGKVVWKTPNPRGWQMTHSSILATTIGGKKTYVYCGSGGVVGVAADTGAILWDSTEWVISTATVATPVPIGDGRLFLSGGYESGAMMIRPEGKGVKVLWRVQPSVFGAEQQTPILYQGKIYGVIPNGQLVCLDLDGKQLWKSGERARFGLGPYVIADGLIFVMNDSGTLSVVEASPKAFRKLGELKVLSGPDAWGPPAVAGGRLIVRDLKRMICIDVAKH